MTLKQCLGGRGTRRSEKLSAAALLVQPKLRASTCTYAGIGVAVRALQPDRQLPALARLDVPDGLARAVPALVPRQRHVRRRAHGGIERVLDPEVEADALVETVRQRLDDADDVQVAALVGRRQRRGKRRLGQQCRPCVAGQQAGEGDRGDARRRPAQRAAAGQQDQHGRGAGHHHAAGRERRGGLQAGDARDEAQDEAAHGWAITRLAR